MSDSIPILQSESVCSVCIVMKISEDNPGARDGGTFSRSLIMGPCRGVMSWLNGSHLPPVPPHHMLMSPMSHSGSFVPRTQLSLHSLSDVSSALVPEIIHSSTPLSLSPETF